MGGGLSSYFDWFTLTRFLSTAKTGGAIDAGKWECDAITRSFGGMMHDKPLDPSERTLLKILAEMQAAHGPVSRDALSVATRGRGVEFGRAFARVKSLGLMVEVQRRPFFLRRLFGAQTLLLIQLTEAGHLALSNVPEPPAPKPAPPPVEPAMVHAPAVAPTPSKARPAVEPVGKAQAPKPAPPSPSWPLPPPIQSTAAQPKAVKRRVPQGFAEDLGGVPMPPEPVIPADPAGVAALRDVLSGLGIELTQAGEMLVNHRMAQGANAAEALMQVIVFTFAHAVHLDAVHGRQLAGLGLADYAVDVQREVQKLRDAGAVSVARYDTDMGQLAVLMGVSPEAATLAATLLQDPYGGAAPPALLPEDLRARQSDDADEADSF